MADFRPPNGDYAKVTAPQFKVKAALPAEGGFTVAEFPTPVSYLVLQGHGGLMAHSVYFPFQPVINDKFYLHNAGGAIAALTCNNYDGYPVAFSIGIAGLPANAGYVWTFLGPALGWRSFTRAG